MNPREKVDEVIQQAKKFLKENKPAEEPNYYVNSDGDLIPLDPDLEYDYKRDYLRFKGKVK